MKKEELAEKIEALGDASDYNGQASAFLEATGAKIEARYIATRPHFAGEDKKDTRDVYEVRITRGSRSHSFEFGESIRDTEERIALLLGESNAYLAPRVRLGEDVSGLLIMRYGFSKKMKQWEEDHKKMLDVQDADAGQRPSAYSILAGMQSSEPPRDVDAFAREFGYEKPSEAIRVFEAVQNEWRAMRELFTDDELEALQRIA